MPRDPAPVAPFRAVAGPVGGPVEGKPSPGHRPYDKRNISYATTFEHPGQRAVIRTVEWLTGKVTLLRLIRRFEREGVPEGQAFWARALKTLGISLATPDHQIRRIPQDGPVVVVANHPHGLVDGMILAEMIGRVRQDYRILTRSLLTGVEEVRGFLLPVPFPHEPGALQQNLDMRRQAMEHLAGGGLVALFPSGTVAASPTFLGPAVEAEWNPFTARLIQRSRATVVPVHFPGQNSRAYLMANLISATLRQGLLLHEVVHAMNRPQTPVVGTPLSPDELQAWGTDTSGFVRRLRECTLGLGAA